MPLFTGLNLETCDIILKKTVAFHLLSLWLPGVSLNVAGTVLLFPFINLGRQNFDTFQSPDVLVNISFYCERW